jgi:hypothetical protein
VLREAQLDRLKTVVAEAKAAGLVVDVTFTRDTFKKADGTFLTVPESKTAILVAADALDVPAYGNVLIDVQNELNCGNPGQPLTYEGASSEVKSIQDALNATHPSLP